MNTQYFEHKVGELMNNVKTWIDDVSDTKANDLETLVNRGNELNKMYDDLLFSISPDERMKFPESTQKVIKATVDLYFEGFTCALFPLRSALKAYNNAVMTSKLFKLSKWWYAATEQV